MACKKRNNCERCGKVIFNRTKSAKYCLECITIHTLERKGNNQRKYDKANREDEK